jgi:predicted nucleic acid-binding protein
MIVADTDVLIDFLRGHEPMAGRIAFELERGSIATTAVSRFELKAGARGGAQQALVETLLAALPVLPLDGEAADRAAEVRRHFEQQGAAIGMADTCAGPRAFRADGKSVRLARISHRGSSRAAGDADDGGRAEGPGAES